MNNILSKIFFGLAIFVLFVPTGVAEEPSAGSDSPQFEISRFEVEGNSLLPTEKIDSLLARFTGKEKDFGDVQRALEALERAYQDIGYGAVQVTLPEQELEKGIVHFKIIEPRIRAVQIEGNKNRDEDNIRASLPALKEDEVPNSSDIAENLRVANENPSKQTSVLLRGGENEGEIDATVKITDDKPWKAAITFDNTGTRATGAYRLGVAYQYSNIENRDRVLTMQFITAPEKMDDVKIFGLGYRVPFYQWGSSADFIVGYSNVDSGTIQDLFDVAGSGLIWGFRYNMFLPKFGDYDHKLVIGQDIRDFNNDVFITGTTTTLVPDITINPTSLTYSASWRSSKIQTNYYLGVSYNLWDTGTDSGTDAFQASRSGAVSGYRIFRYGGTWVRAYSGDWQTRVVFNGQQTNDALVSGEQFGVGGADNVRGFNERQVANDRGFRGNFELYSPDLGIETGPHKLRTRALLFYDFGSTSRNKALLGESTGEWISSMGMGLRAAIGTNFSLRLDLANVLNGGGGQEEHSTRVHANFAYVF